MYSKSKRGKTSKQSRTYAMKINEQRTFYILFWLKRKFERVKKKPFERIKQLRIPLIHQFSLILLRMKSNIHSRNDRKNTASLIIILIGGRFVRYEMNVNKNQMMKRKNRFNLFFTKQNCTMIKFSLTDKWCKWKLSSNLF